MNNLKALILDQVLKETRGEFKRINLEDDSEVDGSKYVTSSEMDRCARQLYYQKHQHEDHKPITAKYDIHELTEMVREKPNLQFHDGYFIRGREMEDWVIRILQRNLPSDYGLVLVGDEQRTIVSKNYKYAGTPDGVLVHHPSKTAWVLEIKSTHHTMLDADPMHELQTASNTLLVQQELSRHYDVIGGQLIYIDVSNWTDIRVFRYGMSECRHMFYTRGGNRTDRIIDGPLESLGFEGIAMGACSDCAFLQECKTQADNPETLARLEGRATGSPFPDLTDEEKAALKERLAEYYRMNMRKKVLEMDLKEMREEIEADLITAGTTEFGNGVTATMRHSTRVTTKVDAHALRARDLDPDDFVEKKVSDYYMLTFKEPKEPK